MTQPFGSYELYRGLPPVPPPTRTITNINTVNWDDSLAPITVGPQVYNLRVVTACGYKSPYGTQHESIFLTASPAPFASNLSWTPYVGWTGVNKYYIYRRDTGAFTLLDSVAGSVTTYTDSGLCGTPFTYYVVGTHPQGLYRSRSNNAQVTPAYTFNNTPVEINRTTVVNNKYTNTTWSTGVQPFITQYLIDRDIDGLGTWPDINIAILPATQLSWTDMTADVQKHFYNYRIRFTNACGDTSLKQTPPSNSILLNVSLTDGANVYEKNPILRWNPYLGWAGGVLLYQIQLKATNGWQNIATVPAAVDSFVDDNQPRDSIVGPLCYRVFAIENAIIGITDSSLSNEGCVQYPSRLFYPTAFTPGKSITPGLNDYYFVSATGMAKFNVRFYTRFGSLIYESTDPDFKWDGKTTSGKEAEQAPYTMMIEALGNDGVRYKIVDMVSLIR